MSLSFPTNSSQVPVGAKVADGCISCPEGTGYNSDVAIMTLEAMTNNLLLLGYQDAEVPSFPLSTVPVRPSDSNQLTGNKRYRYSVGYDDLHRQKFYDPTPQLTNFNVTRELLDQCGGNIGTAQFLANANSIGCAPPMGERGISGKRTYGETAVHGVLTMGPMCVTDYLDQLHFASHLDAYRKAAIQGIAMMLEYEKIRQFVAMSQRNGAAVAGTMYPEFQQSTFPAIPNSYGSLDWLIKAIERGMGGELMTNQAVIVNVSKQLLRAWLEKARRDNNIGIEIPLDQIRAQLQGYQLMYESGDFKLRSMTRNRDIIIRTTLEPVYVEAYSTGEGKAEWDFQRFHVLEPGNDPDPAAAQGFFRTLNPFYGDANHYCEGDQKRLCEMILIHTEDAFEYQAFPTNPLGARIQNVETNMQTLWGSTNFQLYTGGDVDLYFLSKLNKALEGLGLPCYSNMSKTWFAGRVTTGCRFIEKRPERMMSLLVQLPGFGTPIEACETILPCRAPDPIEVTSRPTREPELCSELPAAIEPDDDVGCFQPPAQLIFDLPCEGGEAVEREITFERRGGAFGALAIPFTVTDGTAEEGTEFDLTAGTLTFAEGEKFAVLEITLNPTAKPTGVSFLNAKIVWDNDPEVLCDGAWEETALCFRLCSQIPAEDPQACPDAQCPCVPEEEPEV
jgi:hypothetical protein